MLQFLSVSEFAASTRISRITVLRKIKNNEIPHTRLGRRILIPASFLNDLEEKAKASTPKTEV